MQTSQHAENPLRAKSISTTRGFTLLELLVALVLLVIALSIAYEALHATIRAWRRGTDVVESIQHGNFAIENMCVALRSAVYFNDNKKSYGFELKKGNLGYPADTLSWVTASPAFMPMNSPFRHGAHRITVFIDRTDEGDKALFVSARPHLADEEKYEAESWLVSRGIQGINCRVFDVEEEEWMDTWDTSNSVPKRVEITFYSVPETDEYEAVVFQRILEIPVAKSVKLRLANPTTRARQQSTDPVPGGVDPTKKVPREPRKATPPPNANGDK